MWAECVPPSSFCPAHSVTPPFILPRTECEPHQRIRAGRGVLDLPQPEPRQEPGAEDAGREAVGGRKDSRGEGGGARVAAGERQRWGSVMISLSAATAAITYYNHVFGSPTGCQRSLGFGFGSDPGRPWPLCKLSRSSRMILCSGSYDPPSMSDPSMIPV